MNWYSVFYWMTVADGVKGFFDTTSSVFFAASIISLIIFGILIMCHGDSTNSDEAKASMKYWITCFRRIMIWCAVLTTITWAAYVFTPSKKDAMIIVAGGAVGNFITKDTSARQIPAEVMTLLRDKIRSEIQELHTDPLVDTLATKSKEELVEIIRQQKQ